MALERRRLSAHDVGHLARHFAGHSPPVAGVSQAHGFRMDGNAADADLLVADVFRGLHRLHLLSRGEHPSGIRHVEGNRVPATYRHLTLDHSFYVMVFAAAAGYFAVIGGSMLLDRVSEAAHDQAAPRRSLLARVVVTLADERWVWIVPVVVVSALYLSVIFQPGHAETGPVMYALF